MLKRAHYIALGIVVVLTLVVLKLPGRTASQFKVAVSGLFIPLFGFSGSAQQIVEKAGNSVTPRADLVKQLEQTEHDNQLLKLRLQQLDEVERENNRLRQHLSFSKTFPAKLKLARVVGRDPANWWKTLKVDVGSRDGVITNCAVLTSDGLVGRVSEVAYTQSQVVLLGDPDCRVAVMIEESREQGVIAPSTSNPLDYTIVEMGFISRNAKLSPGQRIATSGVGGVFPKGVPVGQIVDFRSVGYGLYNEARVKVHVKMNSLEEVFVRLPQ
ncbi:MAG: rod shape-determining protein MreC [Verrucomicrobiales bacterium]|nr:rod shape-determining protein MreC [Verrucomicrobiales bacterium]